ncbi:MAG: cytochrome b/b6 domain-containing protein [Sphingomonadaceae bacterium]|nr:cytochrome b/b6 domain-containing protein [Sphingomonadaceae bacterium]
MGQLGPGCQAVHFGLAWLLLTIISLHIIAAFYHHDRRKDDVLRAMWFGKGRKAD